MYKKINNNKNSNFDLKIFPVHRTFMFTTYYKMKLKNKIKQKTLFIFFLRTFLIGFRNYLENYRFTGGGIPLYLGGK